MKKTLLVFSFISIAVAVGFTQMQAKKNLQCEGVNTKNLASVNDLVSNPECFPGNFRVIGRVNKTIPDQASLILIDQSEVDNCEDACPIKRLPISWQGKMPEKGSVIESAGTLQKTNGKFVFAAQSLKLVNSDGAK